MTVSAARFIGRVGALAVTLGVGAALATDPGIALAAPDDQQSPSASPDDGERSTPDSPRRTDRRGSSERGQSTRVPVPADTDGGDGSRRTRDAARAHVTEPSVDSTEPDTDRSVDEPTVTPETGPAPGGPEPEVEDSRPPARTEIAPKQAPPSAHAATETPPAQSRVVIAELSDGPAPSGTPDPSAPGYTALAWTMLAFARRELAAERTATGSAVSTSAAAAPTNLAPTHLNPITVGVPDSSTGVVTGSLHMADPENKALRYSLLEPPAEGTVQLDTKTGGFTYRPTLAARLRATLEGGVDADTFTVTVSDGTTVNNTAVVVRVPISRFAPASGGQIESIAAASAVAASNSRAYVTSRSGNSVVVIDTSTHTVLTTIGVGVGPTGIAINALGTRVYVANTVSNTVSVIDTATNIRMRDIPVGTGPDGIAISPDGRYLYVLNSGAGTVSKITTSSNRVTGTIRGFGVGASAIAVSRDGRTVFVADTAGDSLKYFSATSRSVKTLTGVGAAPVALAPAPTTSQVYVTGAAGAIALADTRTGAVTPITSPHADPLGVALSRDGTVLVVTNGIVSFIDTRTDTYINSGGSEIGTGSRPPGITFSPDGGQLFVTDAVAGHLLYAEFTSTLPYTDPPTAGDPTYTSPDAATGTLTGSVTGSSPYGPVALRLGSAPSRGRLTYTVTGERFTYTYTPSATARHSAATRNPALTTDSFTVIVTDSIGGIATRDVVVPISPINIAPNVVLTHKPGAATGRVAGTDADRDTLTFTGTSTSKGTVVVRSSGSFTYTPTAAARHAAAAVTATDLDRSDAFSITVDDGHGGIVSVPVTVTIAPKNTAPSRLRATVATPHGLTGLVTGRITGTDADGDAFAYRTTAPTKGTVVVDDDGTFRYTPNEQARRDAAKSRSTVRDSFTVTVDDGHGATKALRVSVVVAPLNSAPTPGPSTIGTPLGSTGAVTGRLTATDAEGDRITFSGPGATAKGSLIVKSDGTFTYTPTATARLNAGQVATAVTDRIEVTATDSRGAPTTFTVDVPVDPARHIVSGSVAVGSAPTAVVFSRDGSRAYVANFNDQTISVVKTDTNTTVGSPIKVAVLPQAIAVNPAGTRLYVAGLDPTSLAGKVTVVNTVTNRVVGSPIAVGAYPTAITVSADGASVYVTNGGAGSVAVIDAQTATLARTITVGGYPTAIALNGDATRAYVTNGREGTLSIIDTAAGSTVGAAIPVGRLPIGIALLGNGPRAYVLDAGTRTLSLLDLATRSVIGAPIALAATPQAMTLGPDGAHLYVAGADGTLAVIDTATNRASGSRVTVGVDPRGVAVSPDGGRIYATSSAGVVNVVRLTSDRDGPVAPATPDTGTTNPNGSVTGNLGISDPTAVTYSVATKPMFGTVSVKSDGSFTYTPNAAARGYASNTALTDTFTVVATNARGVSTAVAYTVPVPPVVSTVSSPRLIANVPRWSTPWEIDSPARTLFSSNGLLMYTVNGRRTQAGSSFTTVGVVDTATNTLIGMPTSVGNDVRSVAITPDGRYLYAANGGWEAVYVLNSGGVMVKEIKTPMNHPHAIAISSDSTRGYISTYNPYQGVAGVMVLDTNANEVLGQPIPLNFSATRLELSSDNRTLYAVDSGGHVALIDTQSRTVLATFDVGTSITELALDSTTERLYVLPGLSREVLVVDFDRGPSQVSHTTTRLVSTGSFAPTAIALSPDRKQLYVTRSDGSLLAVNTANRAVVADVKVGGQALKDGLTVSKDGRQVFLLNFTTTGGQVGGYLHTFDTRTNTMVGSPTYVGLLPSDVALNSDNSRLYVADPARGDLYVFDTGRVPETVEVSTTATSLYQRLRTLTDAPYSRDGLAIEQVKSGNITRVIVYLGGTQWSNPDGPRYGMLRNGQLFLSDHADSDIMARIDESLQGLPQGTEVLLVGYSQGGMDAQRIARHWASGTHRGTIAAVVTYASPLIEPPGAGRDHVIHLQAEGDIVPTWTEVLGGYHYGDDWQNQTFRRPSSVRKSGVDLHGDVQTYIDIAQQFDRLPRNQYATVRDDIARFAGTLVAYRQY